MELIKGAWMSHCIGVLAQMNVFDQIKETKGATALELSELLTSRVDVDVLERMLRAVATEGIVSEDSKGRFGPTDLMNALVEGDDSIKVDLHVPTAV